MPNSTPLPALVAVSAHGRQLAAMVEGRLIEGSPREALETAWRSSQEIVFFGAAGIAVRLAAPLLESKTADPALVVVDDGGRYAVSLLSGHEGGANDLARRVAARLGADAVVTTATEALADRDLVLGIGCSSGATVDDIQALVRAALAEAGASVESVSAIASVDVKQNEPGLLDFADRWHLPLRWFSAMQLRGVAVPTPSAAVAAAVGTPSVAEAAALLESGGKLVVSKRVSANVTAAVARRRQEGALAIVGIGPGGPRQVTQQALDALRCAHVVVGYGLYTDIVREWLPLARCESLPLGEEEKRARRAIELACEGLRVALVCSGDAGIYALAGLVYEQLGGESELDVEVIPGVTAGSSAAALLGAPLMADFATLSLSDLHVPAEVIRHRLEAAAAADLVAVLYNPASRRRRQLLANAREIFLRYRAAETPVGLVRNAYRPGQTVRLCNLENMPLDEVDMFTLVIVGSSQTYAARGRMITRRSAG